MFRGKKIGNFTIYIWRLCLLVILRTPNLESALHQCKLCNGTYNSCSMQFPHYNLTDEDCRMETFTVNNESCGSLEMAKRNYGVESGKMILQTYNYEEQVYRQTALNVTFTDFSWKSIKMRFMQNGNPNKNSCRAFSFTGKFLAIKPTSLYYDCLWSRNDYEEKTFNFEYLASDELSSAYKNYVFTVPREDRIRPGSTDLKNWQVFLYMDISNTPLVILRAQTVPEIYNVSMYKVTVYSGTNKDKVCKEEKSITVKKGDKEFTYEWQVGIFPWNYFFTVQPVNEGCGEYGCFVSRSPDIKIVPSKYVICIVIALPVILVLVSVIICLKYISRDEGISVKPKLLLIYRSTHASHMKVVLELAQYLRKNCNIAAMVDELDVNKSQTQNPFYWYNDAVDQADFIAIVSSPTCCNSISGIYTNVDEVALCILQGKGYKREHSSNMYKLMVFLLPYCSEETLPPEAKNIGLRFRIPYQINEIANYIHSSRGKNFAGRMYYQIRNNFIWNMVYKRVSLETCPEMHAAIQEASAEVKKCLGAQSRTGSKSVKLVNERSTPDSTFKTDSCKSDEQPSKIIKTISESSVLSYSMPYTCFPGNIEDHDLLGNESEVIEDEDLNPDNKDHLLLDGLDL